MNLWMLTYLLTAVFYDWRDFRIPNWLNGAAAAVMLGFCLQRGFELSSMAAGVLIPFFGCVLLFYCGMLGGGDIKMLMVLGIPFGDRIIRVMILSFLWNGIIAVWILWKRRSFRLRMSYLYDYVSNCLLDRRISKYENPNEGSKYMHFSIGILAAYLTLLLGGEI
nr:A24 family peptidase [uncultured Anaerostipes sp.]